MFSQYTSMIEIVDWRLKKDRFTVAKLLGSMPITQRAANLKAFREDPNVSVILMSLKSEVKVSTCRRQTTCLC